MRYGSPFGGLTLRPYQLLCLVCSLGETPSRARDPWLPAVLDVIRRRPDVPITLTCNAHGVYAYQDPGTGLDTHGSPEFNRKRDLDILQRLDLAPGSTLPARTMLMRLFKAISTVVGICGFETVTAKAWQGCPKWKTGAYERGHAKGIQAFIPPRSRKEMVAEKEASLRALYTAEQVTIRPHLLMCSVCQYGGGLRPPYEADNLPELLEMVLTNRPSLSITLAQGADWMICAPCPMRVPALNACVNVAGSGGLSNEKRDLDVLQRLGLTYGSTMPARELYLLLLERVPTTMDICRRDNPPLSVWWDGCGEHNCSGGNENYEKGRTILLQKLRARSLR